MNGAHDCGGTMGFGAVTPEADEPVFHEPWEARMFALMSAIGDVGGWTLDADRSACESMAPGSYITSSYYAHWLNGIEILLQKHGLASLTEIRSGKAVTSAKPVRPTLASDVWPAVMAHGSYRREISRLPRFAIGDHVRARNIHPSGHTRCPRYLRGVSGEIIACHGAHVFPDSNASGKGEDPQYLYTLRCSATDVWGYGTGDLIHADLWEPYLEAV